MSEQQLKKALKKLRNDNKIASKKQEISITKKELTERKVEEEYQRRKKEAAKILEQGD